MDSRQAKGDLEQQLRQMILSNVKIDGPGASDSYQHGRGRGRSNFDQPMQYGRHNNGFSNDHRGQRGSNRGFRDRGRGLRQGYQQNHAPLEPFPHQPQGQPTTNIHPSAATSNGTGHWQNSGDMKPWQARQSGAQNANQGRFDDHSQAQFGGRRPPSRGGQLWDPHASHQEPSHRNRFDARVAYLDDLAAQEIPAVEISFEELAEKDAFRLQLQDIFAKVAQMTDNPQHIDMSLQNFGSLKSGFATKGSDMDLVIVDNNMMRSTEPVEISLSEDGLPRRFEKELLSRGIGARLLTRARVPIIKICEQPSSELLSALKDARDKWDALPDDEKLDDGRDKGRKKPDTSEPPQLEQKAGASSQAIRTLVSSDDATIDSPSVSQVTRVADPEKDILLPQTPTTSTGSTAATDVTAETDKITTPKKREPWLREKKKGPLDFPKDGVGIQCDINFFNPLGIHNTHMLYCYSLCDPRVRPMILFVKAWARKRKINNPYSGTLSSYGYVLMVLHYLVNIARPPVLPNLQLWAEAQRAPLWTIDGWKIHFWSDEKAIKEAAVNGQITHNRDPLGSLLKSFFQYYATTQSGFGFVWMKEVLSLRTPGGVLSKEEKGWTGAKTETTDTKEVRHRYLFAIEDPFELTHNVARTVTHPGIVAIRDEFRRAWRILGAVGNGFPPRDGDLLDEMIEEATPSENIQSPKDTAAIAGGQATDTSQERLLHKDAESDEKATTSIMDSLSGHNPEQVVKK
ncbi:Terminal uridylyltransferase cid1-like protein [Elsinoe fawcettii]|nr:Terminal uridylyltransferase cid1-like protein [Elsinoe fawcettii]